MQEPTHFFYCFELKNFEESINFILDGILNPIQTNDLDSITSIIDEIALMSIVERRKIGQKLRDRIVKNFSIDIVSKKHLNLYESI